MPLSGIPVWLGLRFREATGALHPPLIRTEAPRSQDPFGIAYARSRALNTAGFDGFVEAVGPSGRQPKGTVEGLANPAAAKLRRSLLGRDAACHLNLLAQLSSANAVFAFLKYSSTPFVSSYSGLLAVR